MYTTGMDIGVCLSSFMDELTKIAQEAPQPEEPKPHVSDRLAKGLIGGGIGAAAAGNLVGKEIKSELGYE